MTTQRTHWDDCWREHPECAREWMCEARDLLTDASKFFVGYQDGSCPAGTCPECEMARLLKRITEFLEGV